MNFFKQNPLGGDNWMQKMLVPDGPKVNNEKLDIKIEMAEEKDWQTVKDLRLLAITGKDKDMFNSTPELIEKEENMTEEEWKKRLFGDDRFVMLTWNGSEPIAMIRAWEIENKEGAWFLANAYVKENFQRMGVGKSLYRAPIDELKKRGVLKVMAMIREDNQNSRKIVDKIGFTKGKITDYPIGTIYRSYRDNFIPVELDLTKEENKI